MSTQGTLQIQTQSIYTSLLVQSCHLLQLCARMVLRTDAARFVGYTKNVVLLILGQPSDMCCPLGWTGAQAAGPPYGHIVGEASESTPKVSLRQTAEDVIWEVPGVSC